MASSGVARRQVAVTGASGFVGRNLIGPLERAGFAAIPLSRTRLAHPGWRPAPDLGQGAGVEEWRRALEGVDAVVHAAARAHVMKEHAPDPLDVFRKVNRDGAIAMARGAAAAGVRRIVFLSSVKVLGETTAGRAPFDNDDPLGPADPYAISKADAEQALGALADELQLELLVLRPPLVYGPGVAGNLRTLIRLINRGSRLPLGAVSGNRRSMISTANLSGAIVAALNAPPQVGGPFLVSDGDDLSTRDLLLHLATAAGRPARLANIPVPALRLVMRATGQAGLATRLLDDLRVEISGTARQLGWRPHVTVAAGMAAMLGAEDHAAAFEARGRDA